jgi:hypothetical protein
MGMKAPDSEAVQPEPELELKQLIDDRENEASTFKIQEQSTPPMKVSRHIEAKSLLPC